MTSAKSDLPGELRQQDQWANWMDAEPDDLPPYLNHRKQPYYGPTKETAWTSEDGSGPLYEVIRHVERNSFRDGTRGVGYVFLEDDGYVAIDLDGCLKDDGSLKDWVPRPPWMMMDDWAEVSQSETGLHTAVKGVSLPWWWTNNEFDDEEHVGVECYGGNRFFAFTGDLWQNHGTTIPEVGQDVFEGWLKEVYGTVEGDTPWEREPPQKSTEPSETDVELGIYDVIPRSVPRGKKVKHPFHGSNSGINFQVDTDAETFRCWRHEVTGNPHHLLGMESGVIDCGDWDTRNITDDEWRRIYDYGRQKGYDGIPSKKPQQNSSMSYEEHMQQRAEKYQRQMEEVYQPDEEEPQPQKKETVADGGQSDGLSQPLHQGFEVHNGGYGVWVYDGDDGQEWQEWTSFQIELNATIRSEDDGEIRWDLTIHPAGREDPFDVQVEPAVFNSKQTFKRNVCIGESTYFDGTDSNLNTLRTFVSRQDRVDRVGVNHMGYHDGVWVTPNGTMGPDGWIDDPETVLFEKGIEAERKWSLHPDDGDEYDEDEVASMVELLPKTRNPERFLSLMGWFYSTPFRPLIMDWEGEYNYMCVTGKSGAGKSTTLSMMWKMFGMDGDPLSIKDTDFVRLVTMASSNAVPMFFDEHKPSDIPRHDLNDFYEKLRKSTRGGVGQRGNEDLGSEGFALESPLLVAGEESVKGSAEERRGIFTDFSKVSTDIGTNTHINHMKLAGGDIASEGLSFEGHDLSQHALAYIQWVLFQDVDDLHDAWREAGHHASDIVREQGVDHIEDLMLQGLQTASFGCEMYRRFAESVGANPNVITDDEIDDAMVYALTEGRGGVNRKSHVDDFFEIASRAADQGLLEEDKHYTFVYKGCEREKLRLSIAKSHDIVKRYAREYDVSEEILNDKQSYYDRFRDCDGAVYQTGNKVKSPPIGRAVGIDPKLAEEKLDGFKRNDWDPSYGRAVSFHDDLEDLGATLYEIIEENDVENFDQLTGFAMAKHGDQLDPERVPPRTRELIQEGAVYQDDDGLHVA